MANGKATNSADEEQSGEGDATTDPEVPVVVVPPETEARIESPAPPPVEQADASVPVVSLAPSVGQSVRYVTSWGETLSALVQGVWSVDVLDVQVDGPDRHFAVSQILYDETKQPGTWHWIEQE